MNKKQLDALLETLSAAHRKKRTKDYRNNPSAIRFLAEQYENNKLQRATNVFDEDELEIVAKFLRVSFDELVYMDMFHATLLVDHCEANAPPKVYRALRDIRSQRIDKLRHPADLY
ncbi:MAG: hypothetical protein A2928_03975 [Candidatus Taylorbacteria bacterium RIFCSPLOWO2_01_FULL_45_15b]|uniref:Uncharacterized protein n=1 Tax=Candidatus Taylorbacteria bacterium RIFCSPLOWO2_01_FULL_45_15b TaxID=1802319 RepID=A0A1G2NG17_9BACT|nr:MAG: hypothetical protein A2928_03975 [Candidatus Taylorbacteria bacterium RIFCSPLOWO2_01_FULL_45_15b]